MLHVCHCSKAVSLQAEVDFFGSGVHCHKAVVQFSACSFLTCRQRDDFCFDQLQACVTLTHTHTYVFTDRRTLNHTNTQIQS